MVPAIVLRRSAKAGVIRCPVAGKRNHSVALVTHMAKSMQRRRQGEEGQKWHRQQKRWRFIGSTNIIPSKLLICDFHYIIKLIIVELRNRHKKSGNNGAGVFLVYLVREKLGCHGHTER